MSRYTACTQTVDMEMGNAVNDFNTNSCGRQSKQSSRNRSKKVSQEVRYRVVVLGVAGVGKSTIINRFLYGRLPEDMDLINSKTSYLPDAAATHTTTTCLGRNMMELHEAHYDVEDTRLTLEVLEVADDDTSGPEWREAVASGDAFVIAYSVSNDESREAVSRLRDELLEQHCYLHLSIMVVANKTDMDDGTHHVQNVIAEMVALEEWGHGHAFTSATKDASSLKSIFLELFRQVAFPPDHVMKCWLDLHNNNNNNNNSRQRKRSANIFHRLSQRIREFIGGPQQNQVLNNYQSCSDCPKRTERVIRRDPELKKCPIFDCTKGTSICQDFSSSKSLNSIAIQNVISLR